MGSVGTSSNAIEINGSVVSREDLNSTDTYNDIRRFGFSHYIVQSNGNLTQPNPNNPNLYMTMSTTFDADRANASPDTLFGVNNGAEGFNNHVANTFRNESSVTVQSDRMNGALSAGLTQAGFVHVGESRPTSNTMPYHLWQKRK